MTKERITLCNDVSCKDLDIEVEDIPSFIKGLDKEIEVIMNGV